MELNYLYKINCVTLKYLVMVIVGVIYLLKIIMVQNLTLKKKEGVGHVQKRVGCRLRNLKKKEKGIGRKGKLSNIIIDKLQNYYGIAIRQNKDNVTGMQVAVKAAHIHVALSKDNNHHFPPGKDIWCA